MTRFPNNNRERLVAWAQRHGIHASVEKHVLVCPLDGFEEPLRAAVSEDEVIVLLLPLPLTDQNADLGLVEASLDQRRAILGERALGEWKPQEFYYSAKGETPAHIDTVSHLYLGEGATDIQLDEGMSDALDALFDAVAFHPSVVMAAADASVNAAGAPQPVTWKMLDYRRQQVSETPVQLTNTTENSERIPWWEIDQEKVGKAVTAQRLIAILRWNDAEISCEKRGENDVISLRRKGMPIEVKVSPQGRMSVSYLREFTSAEAENPRLKEYLDEKIGDYGWVHIGMRTYDAGISLRFECWQPAMRVTEEQIDAFIEFALKEIRARVDGLDQALQPAESADNGE